MLYDTKWDKEVLLDEVGEILLKAADYIDKHGWCQRRAFIGKKACLLGAVAAVIDGGIGTATITPTAAYEKAYCRLAKLVSGMGNWNDAPGRTKDEVVAVLRTAAYLE